MVDVLRAPINYKGLKLCKRFAVRNKELPTGPLAAISIPVIGVFPTVDGTHCILFHVEQIPLVKWEARWRLTGNLPDPYLVWRSATNSGRYQILKSEKRFAEIEVQWRWEGETDWRQSTLLQLGIPRAEFVVEAEADLQCMTDFHIVAPIRNDGVAAYRFPGMVIEKGQIRRIEAVADAPSWPNVLLSSSEFRQKSQGLIVENVAPSVPSWRIVPHSGLFRLAGCPHTMARRWWTKGVEKVDPALLRSIEGGAP